MPIDSIYVQVYNKDNPRKKPQSKEKMNIGRNKSRCQKSTLNKRKGLDDRPTRKNIVVSTVCNVAMESMPVSSLENTESRTKGKEKRPC